MNLRDAGPDEIAEVLSHTHALWADGLEMDAYADFIATLMASEWAKAGERNYRFLVLTDDVAGDVAAAVKLYRFAARLEGRLIHVGGIGAVFTLPHARRRGYAADLIGRAHAIMKERGDALSLLHSEIGARYYAGLGYRQLPAHAVRIKVPAGGPPASGMRAMHRNDLGHVMRIRERDDGAAPFALVRDAANWKYLLARASYPTLHLGRERWEKRVMLMDDHSGYMWSHFGEDHMGAGARLLEFGEVEPGAALPALLDDFFEECRRRGVGEVESWMSPSLAGREERLAGPLLTRVEPPPVVPMWFPLDDAAAAVMSGIEARAVLHLTDVF